MDRDRRGPQRTQTLDQPRDRDTGLVLNAPGDGQRREHDGQMRLDRITRAVEHRPRPQIGLRHPKRLLDMPQVVVLDVAACGDQELGRVRGAIPSWVINVGAVAASR